MRMCIAWTSLMPTNFCMPCPWVACSSSSGRFRTIHSAPDWQQRCSTEISERERLAAPREGHVFLPGSVSEPRVADLLRQQAEDLKTSVKLQTIQVFVFFHGGLTEAVALGDPAWCCWSGPACSRLWPSLVVPFL